uniref:Uncharacterized protein n=1 Tax=Acrobeloides nanus TaxID=290746 RepID=A0A914CFP2_9BILA
MRSNSRKSSLKSDDWRFTLRQQIEQLAKKNAAHKRFVQAKDRTQEMDRFILELRQLLSTNEIEAAKFLPSCISYIDETEKILSSSKLPPTYSSRSTTPCRVFPIVDDKAIELTSNSASEQKLPVGDDLYGHYDYRSRWWRILCMNSGKEAKERQQGENLRDLWNTQVFN